jgi:stage III sporulation protein AE
MAFRTAKYVSSTFIPIIGKPIGDTMDMFFVSAYNLRSALGVIGSIALLAGVFPPFIQVLSCLAVWKVSAAVLGPISGANVRKSLKSMSDGVVTIATATFVTSFCFVICLSLVAHAVRPF